MGRFVVKRLLQSIPLIIFMTIFAFFVIHIMPGDPVRNLLGDKATEEQILQMQKSLNLDKPITEQFWMWIKGVFRFDFGKSLIWNEPAAEIIIKRIEPTFILAIIGTFISTAIGIPLGILSAKKQGRLTEKALSLLSLVSISLPTFWVAILMIQMLCVKINLFPVAGYHTIADSGFAVALKDLALPGIILGIMHSGQIGRMTKNSMQEIMQQDYLRTARACGIRESKVLNYYGLKNALSSVIVVIGFSFAGMLAGAAVIEQIFNIPGIGSLATTSIAGRDYPLIQGTLFVISLVFIFVNLLVDLLCAFINPKVRYENE